MSTSEKNRSAENAAEPGARSPEKAGKMHASGQRAGSSFLLTHLREGLLTNNPTFVQLLGMCPTLAVTTSVSNAVGMGLSATAVLIFSNFFISLLRRFIPSEVRIAAYIVIISGFVSAIELLLQAFVPTLYASLGLFIPLIVVNCIILARAEAFASRNRPLPAMWDGVCMGLGFTMALTMLGFIRELLGAGTVLGYDVTGGLVRPAMLFVMPAGAFITLAFLIAGVNAVRQRSADRKARASSNTGKESAPAAKEEA